MPATAEGLLRFIASSPSPFHCVQTAAARLLAAGFVEHQRHDAPRSLRAGEGGLLREAGTLLAWRTGTAPPAEGGFRIVVAHTDSPNLRLKPRCDFSSEGYDQWGLAMYGGVTLATWTARDLGVSGRVGLRTPGGLTTRLVRIDRPIARLPNLAIHLDRSVNDKGLKLDQQRHLVAMLGRSLEGEPGWIRGLCSEQLGCAPDDILDFELGLHDTQAPALGGVRGEFIFAPRLDNQFCSYVAVEALHDAQPSAATQVVVLYDHEEVGSVSARGAESVLLRNLLRLLERDHVGRAPGGLERALARSYLVSADMAHGVHPGHADRHEPHHKPLMGGGPVIKTSARMRYQSDSLSASRFRLACLEREITAQDFVIRGGIRCGSTVGPYCAAQLGVSTVDVGCAMLSMHSIREQAGAGDIAPMAVVMRDILESGHPGS